MSVELNFTEWTLSQVRCQCWVSSGWCKMYFLIWMNVNLVLKANPSGLKMSLTSKTLNIALKILRIYVAMVCLSRDWLCDKVQTFYMSPHLVINSDIGHRNRTRLHSSRMRTARVLTVSPSMLCGGYLLRGAVSALGGCLLWGCVCSGVCVCLGCVCSGGVSALGVCVCSGWVSAPSGCLLWGVCSHGVCVCFGAVCSQGGLLPRASAPGGMSALGAFALGGVCSGGVCSWGCVSQHALRQPSLLVNRITHACENITLPNFIAGGNQTYFAA